MTFVFDEPAQTCGSGARASSRPLHGSSLADGIDLRIYWSERSRALDRIVHGRRLDDGTDLILHDAPSGAADDQYAVSTQVCDNPACVCLDMWLSVRRIEDSGENWVETGDRSLTVRGAAQRDAVDIVDVQGGVFPEAVTNWIVDRLRDDQAQAWLSERWRRLRGQVGDPAYPSGRPPAGVNGMIYFAEVFPYDYELVTGNEGRVYLFDDCYCLEPACPCDHVVMSVVDLDSGEWVGQVDASVRRLRDPKLEGPPKMRRLWNRFLDDYGPTVLRDRHKRMRKVATSRGESPRTRGEKIGRNAPCPCGSGKKYKRCCG